MKTCLGLEWMEVLFGHRRWVHRWRQRHQAHCPHCRRLAERWHSVESSLRQTACRPAGEAPPAHLASRIRAAIAADSAHRVAPRPTWGIAGALLGTAAAVVFVVWLVNSGTSNDRAAVPAADAAYAGIQAVDLPRLDQTGVWRGVAQATEAPLASEMEKTLADGRAMFSGMLESVLPESAARRVKVEAESWLGLQ